MNLYELFGTRKPILGMVHLGALPGTPGFRGDFPDILNKAISDAAALEQAGFDGVIVENFNDIPYEIEGGNVQRAVCMAIATSRVSRAVAIPVGVNIQWNDYEAENAVATWAGGSFIRVEVFVDSVLTPSGPVYGCSDKLQRIRAKTIGASPPLVLADVAVKESIPLKEVNPADTASIAFDAGAHGVIITGAETGKSTPLDTVRSVKERVAGPVVVGSGVNGETISEVMRVADGCIIGTATKLGGKVDSPVDVNAARALVETGKPE